MTIKGIPGTPLHLRTNLGHCLEPFFVRFNVSFHDMGLHDVLFRWSLDMNYRSNSQNELGSALLSPNFDLEVIHHCLSIFKYFHVTFSTEHFTYCMLSYSLSIYKRSSSINRCKKPLITICCFFFSLFLCEVEITKIVRNLKRR